MGLKAQRYWTHDCQATPVYYGCALAVFIFVDRERGFAHGCFMMVNYGN